MITQKNPVGRYAVEINSTATAAESPIHNPKFAPPVTSYSLPATAAAPPILLPANPVLLSKIHPKIINTMSSDLIPSDYAIWLAEVKTRIQSARSALAVSHAH
jgi:hypothetical protein